MQRSSLYLWIWLTVIAASAPVLLAQESRPAAEVLADAGLTRLAGTNIWALRREHEFRQRLSEIPEHRQAIAALETALSDRIEQNYRQWTTAQTAAKALAGQLAAIPPGAARSEMAQQLAQLQSQMIAPDRLGEQDDVRKLLVELTNRRNALWLALASVRHDVPKLAEGYLPLTKEPQLTTALRQLGGNHRLGPAKDYVDEVRKISDFDRVVLTDWVPMYAHGGHQRVSALLNESTPATFSWSTSPEPTIITSAMAHAAGISVPAQAPRVSITLAKNRTYSAARISIAYLRLGKHLLRDVETLVLPPEGEDLGARLSVAAFSGFRAQSQPQRLRLLIEPSP